MSNAFREDFPIFQGNDVIYFDNAATTQRPRQVMEAMRQFNDTTNANPLRGLYAWSMQATEEYEKARHKAADLLHASRDCEVIFTRNTTESLNLVAFSYGLSHVKAGDEIVLSVMEHHSNILPWQMVARQTGAKLAYLEPDLEGRLTDEELESKITDKAAIVTIGHVSNVLGVTNPVKKIAELAHRHGAICVVDGAQSAPHIPVNVQEIGCDFYAFSGHKLLAPMGIGGLYGRFELLDEMPPFLSGGEMIEYVTRETATYAEVPEKFEAGTVNAMGAVGLGAAIDYLKNVGFETIMETEKELTTRLMEGLSAIPEVTVYGSKDPENHCGIVAFNVEGCHPHDVASVLDTEHIDIRAGHHCAQPLMDYLMEKNGMPIRATARASLYFYNTAEEVDRFVSAVSKLRSWLGF